MLLEKQCEMKRLFTAALCALLGVMCASCQADRKGREPEQTTARASSAPEKPKQEAARNTVQITAGGQTFAAELYDTPAAAAFSEMLPVTLEMRELNGNEKYHNLSESLPAAPQTPERVHTGDLMLYGADCLVIFYESFETSYRYTPLGKITDAAGLKEGLGSGSVTVNFTHTVNQ